MLYSMLQKIYAMHNNNCTKKCLFHNLIIRNPNHLPIVHKNKKYRLFEIGNAEQFISTLCCVVNTYKVA